MADKKIKCRNPVCRVHFVKQTYNMFGDFCSARCYNTGRLPDRIRQANRLLRYRQQKREQDLQNREKRYCAGPGCSNEITHMRLDAVYCSRRCAKRTRQYLDVANIRAQRPEVKEKIKQIRKTDENREKNRKRQENRRQDPFIRSQMYDRTNIYRRTIKARCVKYGIDFNTVTPKPEKCENPYCDNTNVILEHCHKTKVFRGWLCKQCNYALGHVFDSPDILRWLADYLEQRSR